MLCAKSRRLLRDELETLSKGKIEIMKKSREIVKTSKQLIYAVHRQDMKSAKAHSKTIQTQRRKLDGIAKTEALRAYHPFSLGLQEYVEAVCYFKIMSGEELPSHRDLKVPPEAYVGGLSDLTGELMRKGVDDMINERYEHALKLKNTVADIYGLMLSLDLDGGEARKKSDAVKWNLAKLEDRILDARLRGKI
jgi:translin